MLQGTSPAFDPTKDGKTNNRAAIIFNVISSGVLCLFLLLMAYSLLSRAYDAGLEVMESIISEAQKTGILWLNDSEFIIVDIFYGFYVVGWNVFAILMVRQVFQAKKSIRKWTTILFGMSLVVIIALPILWYLAVSSPLFVPGTPTYNGLDNPDGFIIRPGVVIPQDQK